MENNQLTPFAPMKQVIQKRRVRTLEQADNRRLLGSIFRLLVLIAVAAWVFMTFFGIRIVHGNEMYPALYDGDLVLCNVRSEYRKNDIVFYTAEGRPHTGRVVAKGGDWVDISQDGTLRVNGTAQVDQIPFHTEQPDGWEGSRMVPEGCVFILGDFRTRAEDSRKFGCIPLEEVQAKVIAVFRHRTL